VKVAEEYGLIGIWRDANYRWFVMISLNRWGEGQ